MYCNDKWSFEGTKQHYNRLTDMCAICDPLHEIETSYIALFPRLTSPFGVNRRFRAPAAWQRAPSPIRHRGVQLTDRRQEAAYSTYLWKPVNYPHLQRCPSVAVNPRLPYVHGSEGELKHVRCANLRYLLLSNMYSRGRSANSVLGGPTAFSWRCGLPCMRLACAATVKLPINCPFGSAMALWLRRNIL
jgi:hypothetical protein